MPRPHVVSLAGVVLAALVFVAMGLSNLPSLQDDAPARPSASGSSVAATFPIVVNTWPFTAATQKAWEVISASAANDTSGALDAVEQGCSTCERMQCDGTVGFGGSPDTTGETTLDAMIMDGTSMDVGAVGDLRGVKDAISVARRVMENTQHTLLAGTAAADFAVQMGFNRTNLSTTASLADFHNWEHNKCQPNYWRNVMPDHTKSCGPYKPVEPTHIPWEKREQAKASEDISFTNHDTIAMLVVDTHGHIVSGTSTNGASHKIAGRVGDSPIMGAGSYADSDVGACGATGDGDVMMRFLPCFRAVQSMRSGSTPTEAAQEAIRAIAVKYPNYQGALLTVNKAGVVGAAGYGWTFTYSIRTPAMSKVQTVAVPPIHL